MFHPIFKDREFGWKKTRRTRVLFNCLRGVCNWPLNRECPLNTGSTVLKPQHNRRKGVEPCVFKGFGMEMLLELQPSTFSRSRNSPRKKGGERKLVIPSKGEQTKISFNRFFLDVREILEKLAVSICQVCRPFSCLSSIAKNCGQFRLSRRGKAHAFSLKLTRLIRTPVNTDTLACPLGVRINRVPLYSG